MNSNLEKEKDDRIFISDKSDKTFLPSMDHHIEDDLLCLQTTLETDIKLNIDKEAIQDIDIDESSWTMDQGIYQNSSNSTSTSTIPTLTDTINSDNPEEVQSVKQEEENINQSEEQVKDAHEDDPDKATIYVPDLSKDTTKKGLMTLFKTFGTIKQSHLKIKKKSKGKNAIIVFSNQHNARSTMLSMNLTMYKDQESKIRMSKKRSFLAFRDKSTISPIAKLCNMVQKMQDETTNTNEQDSTDKKDQITPTDIPEISNLTIKKSTKCKFKQKDGLT